MHTDVGVVVADTHILAETGLLPLDAVDDAGAPLKPNRAQTFVQHNWLATLALASTTLTPIHGGRKYFIHLGDIIEGRHHDSTQVATLNMAAMRRIGAQTLRPWAEWADYVFLLRGTPAHAGHAAADEESIGDLLDALVPGKVQRDTVSGMTTTFHRRITVGGLVIDAAHAPPSGTSRDYLAHGPAGVLAVERMLDYAATGDRPPALAVRGHLHPRRGLLDSGYTYATRGVIVPSWKLVDEFGSKSRPGSVNVIGALFFKVCDGQLELWPVTYTPKRARAWTEPPTSKAS